MAIQQTQVATIILAGGLGTRLHPLTIRHAKPAVAYGGRYRLIDIPISNSINSDFRQIFVITQYLSEEIREHIGETYCSSSHSINIISPQNQEHFQGTADAVRKNLSTLLKSPADYFLILAGDQLYNINFQHIVSFAQSKDADLVIAALPVLEREAKRMGLLQIESDQRVSGFVEKPKTSEILEQFSLKESFFQECKISPPKKTSYLGSMGIYVFKREALASLLEKDSRDDFGYHLISTAVSARKTFAFVYHGYWEDIGTVASYYEANLIMTDPSKEGLNTYDEQNPIYTRPTFLPSPKIQHTKIVQSIICEGSVIEADEISHSVIGLRSHIRRGTIIRDTVMIGNHSYSCQCTFSIGENCLIEKAIIDEHVQIGNGVKLTNKQNLQTYDGQGIFIRDGIIVVIAGTCLPDGFEL